MTTMREVQENLEEANRNLQDALSKARALTGRDFEDEINPEFRQVAWCTPVILRNIIRDVTVAKGADTKAECADGIRDAHEWAFEETTGLDAMVDGFNDDSILSENWHEAADHFSQAQDILDEEYERVNDLGW